MTLKNITLVVAIIVVLGGVAEMYAFLNETSTLIFKDYPIAIIVLIFNGLLYLGGYLKFSNFKAAKPLLLTAGSVSICLGTVWGTYDAYVGFGNDYKAFPVLVPILAIYIGVFVWYISAILKYENRPHNNRMQPDAAKLSR